MRDEKAPVPPLRLLDCTMLQVGGQKMVRVRDGFGVSQDALVPLPLFALVQLFDGARTILDVQAEIARQTGEIFPGAQLERIVEELDGALLLDSPRYRERLRSVLKDWEDSPLRPATHAGEGRCYPDQRKALLLEMDSFFRRAGAVDPGRLSSDRPLRAALAPHIDFHRGGHSYTWAYHEVRRRARGRLFVVLGTSHQPMERHFAITRKAYDTPLGPAAADGPFLDRLEKLYKKDLRRDEFNHKNEHSIEFQAVFLRYALRDEDFTICPILCGGFHESVQKGREPDREADVARFLDALAKAIEETRTEEGREVVLIGGVDLAHVGQHFGDPDRLTPAFLSEVRARDGDLLARAAAVDSRGFFAEVARDGDRRRICGFGPIYTLLGLLERDGARNGGAHGEVLHYDQAVDMENDLCVSFASMAFEDR
jgi:MEMO1 family protein